VGGLADNPHDRKGGGLVLFLNFWRGRDFPPVSLESLLPTRFSPVPEPTTVDSAYALTVGEGVWFSLAADGHVRFPLSPSTERDDVLFWWTV
jgi:hypothetical protein